MSIGCEEVIIKVKTGINLNEGAHFHVVFFKWLNCFPFFTKSPHI